MSQLTIIWKHYNSACVSLWGFFFFLLFNMPAGKPRPVRKCCQTSVPSFQLLWVKLKNMEKLSKKKKAGFHTIQLFTASCSTSTFGDDEYYSSIWCTFETRFMQVQESAKAGTPLTIWTAFTNDQQKSTAEIYQPKMLVPFSLRPELIALTPGILFNPFTPLCKYVDIFYFD